MNVEILWIDDDRDLLRATKDSLSNGFQISCAHTLRDGMKELASKRFDILLLDINIGCENGIEALQLIHADYPELPVVMVSGNRGSNEIVQAIRCGATDYLCKPFDIDEINALIEKVMTISNLRARNDALVSGQNLPNVKRKFIGNSPAFNTMIAQTDRLRGHQANVLLKGESGTGKELLARYIHQLENNAKRPFIAVNCAAIPDGLIESELFGHERGAFTGATQRNLGKFELANGGDIFLDEIGTLKLDLQATILRVLQEKEITRVGGSHSIKVNFRVICATNEPLEEMVKNGLFRMDLYHRLKVVQIDIPNLRKRREDIALLIQHFMQKFQPNGAHSLKVINAEALRVLQKYEWPGNIRELENVIHSLIILTPGDTIDVAALPTWLSESPKHENNNPFIPEHNWNDGKIPSLRRFLNSAEKNFIEHVLDVNEGDKVASAQALGIGRTTLYTKLRELGLMN